MQTSQIHLFDARGIAKRFRHAAIFGALESLSHGETMRFVNDHDPLPLLGQIQQRYGEQIRLAYQQRDGEHVVIDFTVDLPGAEGSGGGCGGGGGGGCGCAGH
ncbi:DUF2249 domain-containing protein [Rivihabitans pingtungensis]|jgi:uncharacterized protein (DUF2249 family)|uniref:DUF2249 domain-containing protein n=1 Tax=Rivihabitans pingtungensis TaxID=1054498 RepID=UPI002356D18A|nr:DUF2249 domain-containing protein [Rivihabitans pingtungensis]MCK6435593.1 DUF2249 domain-containing protein [Rivihabitans pingtungensis]HNX70790.1 DUF2249 domain-containing protein [Rivihabitans pingtungensis]